MAPTVVRLVLLASSWRVMKDGFLFFPVGSVPFWLTTIKRQELFEKRLFQTKPKKLIIARTPPQKMTTSSKK